MHGAHLGLLIWTSILIVAGLLLIYSSSQVLALEEQGDSLYFAWKQLIWAALGVSSMLFLSMMDYRRLGGERVVAWALGVVVLLLLLVLLFGPSIKGAKRWLLLGPVSLQPSEFAKVALVLYLAMYGEARREALGEFWTGLLPPLVVVTAVAGLVMAGRHLGNTAIILASSLFLLYLAGARQKHLLALLVGVLAFGAISVFGFKYQIHRIATWLDPWSSQDEWGYHLLRQRMAICLGGLLGQGLGEGLSKYGHLPEAFKESIFSSLAEQAGLAGAGLALLAYGYVVWCCFDVARRAPDRLGLLLAGGAGSVIGLQVVINTGVQVSLFPPTGVPLPFMSYGGSSLFSSCLLIGLAASVSRRATFLSEKGGGRVGQGGGGGWWNRGPFISGVSRP